MCYNPQMHVLLLRLALGLYSVGLVHSILSVFKKKQTFFKPALVAAARTTTVRLYSLISKFRAASNTTMARA